jgi:hypothetical protein
LVNGISTDEFGDQREIRREAKRFDLYHPPGQGRRVSRLALGFSSFGKRVEIKLQKLF